MMGPWRYVQVLKTCSYKHSCTYVYKKTLQSSIESSGRVSPENEGFSILILSWVILIQKLLLSDIYIYTYKVLSERFLMNEL